jgi:Cys-tRNA(Pro)/Cys-tRNA(Cys) deacylase
MDVAPPASIFLTQHGIAHRIFRHQGSIHSLEQAAKERGQAPDQVVRSILFRLGKGEFVMVLAPGPQQISWPELRTYLGQSRLTMATDDEVVQVTGYRPGSVSPFGLPAPLRILADEEVFAHEEISLGSGERGVAIIMRASDLKAVLTGLEIGKFQAQ